MMVAMVTFIATLIHIYSVGYMSHDATIPRFFSYLSLFTFAMLMLVTADNLVQLFFGWEGVGLASYLLIGYWYDRPSANRAAMKAFVVNRVGDLFFAVGIALVFLMFGSVEFPDIFAHVHDHLNETYHVLGSTWQAYEVIGVLLFLGACGKSAQLGLHTWLPDAMEGPTPVSALIHAATMVTAGRVPDGAHVADPGVRAGRAGLRGLPGCDDGAGGGDHRLRAERHQADHRLLHHVATWIHVPGGGGGSLSGVHLPPCSPTPSSRRCCSWAPGR